MEACRRLPIMPPQVHLETLHLEAWGGPMAGHLGTELLKFLLQDPQRRQNYQLPLATAGTLDVPKDETGALGCPRFSLLFPSPKSHPRHSQCWVFKLNLVTFSSFSRRTPSTSFVRSTVNCANFWWWSTWCTFWLNMLRVHQPSKPTLCLTADVQSSASVTLPPTFPSSLVVFFPP